MTCPCRHGPSEGFGTAAALHWLADTMRQAGGADNPGAGIGQQATPYDPIQAVGVPASICLDVAIDPPVLEQPAACNFHQLILIGAT